MTNTRQLSVSVPEDIDRYLRQSDNISQRVCEAVRAYRTAEQQRRLEEAYRTGREEAEQLNREWEGADARVPE